MKKILIIILTFSFLSNSGDLLREGLKAGTVELSETHIRRVIKLTRCGYSALLNNGDVIAALYFEEGPRAGSYYCNLRVPLINDISQHFYLGSDKKYFDALKNIYDAK